MDADLHGPDIDAENIGDFFLGILFDGEEDETGFHLPGKAVDRLGQAVGQLMGRRDTKNIHFGNVSGGGLSFAKHIHAGIVQDLKEIGAEARAAAESA